MTNIARIRLILPSRLARDAASIARQVGENLGHEAHKNDGVRRHITVQGHGQNAAQIASRVAQKAGEKSWL